MKKLSLKEILEIPQLSLFLDPGNLRNFINNKNTANAIMSELLTEMQANSINLLNSTDTTRDTLAFLSGDNDNKITNVQGETTKSVLANYSKDINTTAYLLQIAYMSKYFLSQLDRSERGDKKAQAEMAYTNGDIVSVNGTNISISAIGGNTRSLEEIKSDLAEGILIVNQALQSEKNPRVAISGQYIEAGINQKRIRMNYSIKDLNDDAKNPVLLRYFSLDKISELLDKRLLSKNTLLKAFSSNAIDKNMAVELMLIGVLTQEEVLKRVFGKSNLGAVALDEDTSFKSKLLLYSAGRISIDALERSVSKYKEESLDLSEELKSITSYYDSKENRGEKIRKLTELLTHNVLDYENTQRFLSLLEKEGKISAEDREYVQKLVSDFKVDELINHTDNEEISSSGGGKNDQTNYVPGLTIDPEKRMRYYVSIGAVKKLKIRGETLIRDGNGSVTKLNSLDGYELVLIPDKKIAALEKLYEVTRDKDGNVVYKRTKEGKLIPAINNATYIMPIEMAKELSEKKNKSDLLRSPYVRRAMHTLGWVQNVQGKMQEINPDIQFNEQNTKEWDDKIKKNYRQNAKRREIQ